VDVNEVITDSLEVARQGFAEGCQVRTELSTVPHVWVDPFQLGQAFLSLLVNAGRAVGAHGIVTVRSYAEAGDVLVQVCDTGKGIEPEYLGKVFDPFFTTEDVGNGTGLGLWNAYTVLTRNRGEITVTSEPDHGACFTTRLPTMNEWIERGE
jgi:signal transduction histidine kinase